MLDAFNMLLYSNSFLYIFRPLNSYLSLIIDVDKTVWNERHWLSQNYPSITKQLSHLMKNLENW